MADKVKVSVLETNNIDSVDGPTERLLTSDIVDYDNTISGLAATDVKDAIDEVAVLASTTTVDYTDILPLIEAEGLLTGLTFDKITASESSGVVSLLYEYLDNEVTTIDVTFTDENIYTFERIDPPVVSTMSIDFDGVNDFTETSGSVPSHLDFDRLSPFSMSIWVKPVSNISSALISTIDNLLNYRGSEIGLVVHTSIPKIRFFLISDFLASNHIQLETNVGIVPLNVWSLVTATYDGSSLGSGVTIYLNGVVQASSVLTDSLTLTSAGSGQSFSIGARTNSTSENFLHSGRLNNSSVWDKELSQAEVTEIYNLGKPMELQLHSAYSNLVGWWKLGDGDIYPTLLDSSVNNENLTMVNMDVADIVVDAP